MNRILFFAFLFLFGLLQAQTKSKGNAKTKAKAEKEWVNPVKFKLTKEELKRPYMEDVLKTRDSLTPKEAERRRKNIAIGNPFAKQGFYPKIATLSRGKYLEFHDRDSIVSIGSVKYNRKQKKIIDFIEEDFSNPDRQPLGDTHGRWMSPDPLSEEYSSWSPYHFVYNNPISNIDPDGMQVLTDFKLLQNGKVERVDPKDGSEKRNDDRLFATDEKGNVKQNVTPVTVNKSSPTDGTIISSLAANYGLAEADFPLGISFGRTSNANDAGNVFMFTAKHSNVEWGLDAFKVGKGVSYTVYTGHNKDLTPPNFSSQSLSKLLFSIHSHKNLNRPSDDPSGLFNDDYSSAYYMNQDYKSRTGSTNFPKNYLLYSPTNGNSSLWQYQSVPSGTSDNPKQTITKRNLGTIRKLMLKNLE